MMGLITNRTTRMLIGALCLAGGVCFGAIAEGEDTLAGRASVHARLESAQERLRDVTRRIEGRGPLPAYSGADLEPTRKACADSTIPYTPAVAPVEKPTRVQVAWSLPATRPLPPYPLLHATRPQTSVVDGRLPAEAQVYLPLVKTHTRRYGLDPALVLGVIDVESRFNPRAISSKGARGLMQLMPGTARDLGITRPFDPGQNIAGGTRYLAMMVQRFGDLRLALAAYNAGPENVKKYDGIPPFAETQAYVRKVLARTQYYKSFKIHDGHNAAELSREEYGEKHGK